MDKLDKNTREYRRNTSIRNARYRARQLYFVCNQLCGQYLISDLRINFGRVIKYVLDDLYERQFIRGEYLRISNMLNNKKPVKIYDHSRILTNFAPKNNGIYLVVTFSGTATYINDNMHPMRIIFNYVELIDLLAVKYKTIQFMFNECIITT